MKVGDLVKYPGCDYLKGLIGIIVGKPTLHKSGGEPREAINVYWINPEPYDLVQETMEWVDCMEITYERR